jgi:hypothetical protein
MMFTKWVGRKQSCCIAPTAGALSSAAARAMAPAAPVEQLESRRFLSATLKVENLDILPGFERLIFNRIQIPNSTKPNYVKDTGQIKLTNTGNQTLTVGSPTISGPFKLVGSLPTTIAAGKTATVKVQFIANKPPAYTYNQTAGYNATNQAGAYIGSLKFKTNDPAQATYTEELAGWFQTHSENNEEPNLQVLINLIANYKTTIAPAKTVLLSEPDTAAKYYGEEVISGYWSAADASKPVGVRQLAAFHTQGDDVPLNWYRKSDKVPNALYTTDGLAGQAFLPYKKGQKGVAAFGTFSPGTAVFGFKIQKEFSDDKLNTVRPTGGGHHVRFYPVRDHNGNKLANLYFMVLDYSQVGPGSKQNYDFQDNVYLVSNVKPAGN